ncbi:YhgE/Pip domain-containing protein [uncultured Clostridium sp.]|jgi:putative membrane protein|uniref:YhgE/Pip domain-containing protein n=1 Tax=uncultured Clostridium sp. TaxID=59620 RepID=UPI00261A69FF|nr:YhgE/Pip domain-containing protein [uncultured Clostridium sp.]
MKNSFKVFKRDLKAMIKNPITLIIVSGLCILPSLYSFLNVIGCWDAYQNTSTLPIAIVNEDIGATIGGKAINIGDSIVANLKTNKTIGWKFVNAQQGNIGLSSGKYFSELIIPKDFSAKLGTIVTSNPVKPELEYRVNTKVGPVANKITEVAQQTLLAQIKSSVMTSLSQQAFTKMNTYGEKANKNKEQIINLKNAVINLNMNIGNVIKGLNSVDNNSNNLNSYLSTMKSTIPVINTSLGQIQTNTNNIGTIVSNTKNILATSLNNISLNLESSKNMISNIGSISTKLVEGNNNSGLIINILSDTNFVQQNIQTDIKFLQSVAKDTNNQNINELISSLTNANNLLNIQKGNIKKSSSSGDNLSNATIAAIQNSTNNSLNSINEVLNTYNNGASTALNNVGSGIVSATSGATNLISNTQNLNGKIQAVLDSASSSSTSASTASKELASYLNQYKGMISSLSAKLAKVNDNNLDQIIGLLQGNPIVMGEFASAPFNFKQEVIYPVANYGSGMTPVYSVLAFWVGMLIAGALIKTEAPDIEEFKHMTIREKFYGKMLTYISIAIVQSLVITIGAKFLLGVQVVNLPLFILSSLVTSITFAIIIFTILGIFGHIGDAIAIILMVVQLSGTGGTYPVQAMPMFFRVVEPFVPFPYGVDVMREAIAGAYWPNTIKDIGYLIAFSIIFIIIGYFVKPKANTTFTRFEEKFKESGIADE